MLVLSLPPSPVNDGIFGGGGRIKLEFSIRPGRGEAFLAGLGDGDGVDDDALLLRLSVRFANAADAAAAIVVVVDELVESSLAPDSRARWLLRVSEEKTQSCQTSPSKSVLNRAAEDLTKGSVASLGRVWNRFFYSQTGC